MLLPNHPTDETFATQTVHGDTFSVPLVVIERYRAQSSKLRRLEEARRAAITRSSRVRLGKAED